MFEQILSISNLSIRFLPFVLICLALKKVNLAKEKRYRQLPMIPLALIYSAILIARIEGLMTRIYGMMDRLTEIIPLLGRIDWSYWTLLFSNMVVLTLYLTFKGALLPVIDQLWKIPEKYLRERMGFFYEYEAQEKQFFLKEKWGQFRLLYTIFYYVLVAYGTVLLIVSYRFHSLSCFSYRFYPVYGIILFGEIAAYLSGMTWQEHEDELPEEEQEAHRNDYTGLRDKYLELYGSRILLDEEQEAAAGTREPGEEGSAPEEKKPEKGREKDAPDASSQQDEQQEEQDTVEAVIGQLLSSSVNVEQAFGDYLKRERALGTEFSADYILSARGMLRGQSVLFANPFYRDLGGSVFFPFNIALLRHGNGLVIIGRDGMEDEVRDWVLEGLEQISHVPQFWKTACIADDPGAGFDIGILSLKDMNNISILSRYREFFSNVTFVLMLEPSRIVTMNQLSLSILSYMIGNSGRDVVYCCCDRNTDGEVDALSHILRTSMTQVGATVSSPGALTVMGWDIDGDYLQHRLYPNIVRYLGGGISVASVALRHGIDKISWYGGDSMPLQDIRWIAGQYFEPITKYIGRSVRQDVLEDSIRFSSYLWDAPVKKDQCLIVEDEYCNLFEMSRQFSTRARKQTFLHVLAPHYMLRDYMCDNPEIFRSDAKAIPQIVADFARTRRNSAMQLIMLLIGERVSDREISQLMAPAQIQDPITRDFLDDLISEFYDISGYGSVVRELASEDEFDVSSQRIIRRHYYTITNERFITAYASELRTAYYLAEDDETMAHFLGGRLKGHIYQTYLPGQLVTLSGKYYEVLGIQEGEQGKSDVLLVRRAADHITDRRYYRQLRGYQLDSCHWDAMDGYHTERSLNGIRIHTGYVDMTVRTEGYLEMTAANGLEKASRVQVNGIPDRVYRKKYALKVELPDVPDQVRTQIALMMNEIFRTIYPECCQYITAVTDCSWCDSLYDAGMAKLSGEAEPNVIYILEDSQIDLGLTISVERYLERILQIICDYSQWSLEVLTPPEAEKDPGDVDLTGEVEEAAKDQPEKKKGFFARLLEWLRKFFARFGRKKKKAPEGEDAEGAAEGAGEGTAAEGAGDGTSAEDAGDGAAAEGAGEGTSAEDAGNDTAAEGSSDGAAAEADETVEGSKTMQDPASPDQQLHSLASLVDPETGTTFDGEEETETRKVGEGEGGGETAGAAGEDDGSQGQAENRFATRHYLRYGGKEFPAFIDLDAVCSYLKGLGFGDSPFSRVRRGSDIIREIEKTYHPEDKTRTFCDFCGTDVTELSYEVLKDGRCRCARCTATAVRTMDEFSGIFLDVRKTMERRFGIQLRMPIRVKMVSAKTLGRVSKHRYTASSGFDPRCVGLAVSSRGGYTLYVENGAPKENTMETISHELTHIWQYSNWKKSTTDRYPGPAQLMLYEGMAVWVSLQFMMLTEHVAYAKRLQIITRQRDDEYGKGYLLYEKKYGEPDGNKRRKTPFAYPDKPL